MLTNMTSEFEFSCTSTSLTYYSTALVSCEIVGTSFAFCRAKETIYVQGTLAPKDLNWMDIPLTEASSPSSSTPTAKPTEAPLAHLSNSSWYYYQSYIPPQSLLICSMIPLCYLTITILVVCYDRIR